MGEVVVSFLGTYTHTLDSKGRLTIPARLRDGLGEGLVLTRGFDRCLILYPQDVWQQQTQLLLAMPRTSEERRIYERWVYGGASEVVLDGLGRILVPDYLREWAGLRDQARIVGTNAAIEIWSPEQYDMSVVEAGDKLPVILKSIAEKNAL